MVHQSDNLHPSPILTSEEAARFLRLDDDYEDIAHAVEALKRLARNKKLHPIKGLGKKHKWHIDELLRYSQSEGVDN